MDPTWVSPDVEPGRAGHRPAYRLRGELHLARPVRRATLHATAHGIYEATADGVRVSPDELTPGYTDYHHHLQVQSWDVTGLLDAGDHAVEALLADGWYRGQVGLMRAGDQWGTETALWARLDVEHDDGTRTTWGTGAGWRWSPSHITLADLIEGQHTDKGNPTV